jgi:uncharacterized protein YaiL (DUF2058 family)
MSSSLREQLLKAGLVTEADVRRASQPPPRRSKREAAPVPAATRSARDADALRQREKAERKARGAEIDQWIEQNRVALPEGDEYFSFVDQRKIGRVAVNPTLRTGLTRGELAVVRHRGRYAVVPESTAAKIRARSPERVVGAAPDEARVEVPHAASDTASPAASPDRADDPYRDFPVPDDLVW